jgi:hypothetical protein
VTLTPALQPQPEKKRPGQPIPPPPIATQTPAQQAPPELRKKTAEDFTWSAPKQVIVWIKVDGTWLSGKISEAATFDEIIKKAHELFRTTDELVLYEQDRPMREFKFRRKRIERVVVPYSYPYPKAPTVEDRSPPAPPPTKNAPEPVTYTLWIGRERQKVLLSPKATDDEIARKGREICGDSSLVLKTALRELHEFGFSDPLPTRQ